MCCCCCIQEVWGRGESFTIELARVFIEILSGVLSKCLLKKVYHHVHGELDYDICFSLQGCL